MTNDSQRVAWVDYAKGFCIIMVVMMHSTLGVEKAAGADGWLHALVAFATPFRMPDFFMISGLFLSRVIDRNWRDYLDRKVVHFGYFYLLWLTIQFAFKAPGMIAESSPTEVAGLYLVSLVDPFGTIWFIYLLPIFFVVVKATRRLPAPVIWLAAVALEIAPIATGSVVIDEFAARFVYFYAGYMLAPWIFRFSATVGAEPRLAVGYLAVWSLVNGAAVAAGIAAMPVIGLGLGFLGAIAVVTLSTLMAQSDLMAPVRFCGRNSIIIYLAFFLPMAAARTALLATGIVGDLGTVSLLVTAAGVVFPLVLWRAVRGTPGRFLFERPAWARLEPRQVPVLIAAE